MNRCKLLVASEYTEPSFFISRVILGLEGEVKLYRVGFLLITKNILSSLPIWEAANRLSIPTVTHATITGLGGSKIEPQVPNWKDSLLDLKEFLTHELHKDRVVLRIDPLVPGVTDFSVLTEILDTASSFGLTRCRTSVIDYYPFVREKFSKGGLPTPSSGFEPPEGTKLDMLIRLFTICENYGMKLESCAENLDMPGLLKVGCADRKEWSQLGLELPRGYPKRENCFCNVTKYDLLSHEPSCPNNCLYCYWGKFR